MTDQPEMVDIEVIFLGKRLLQGGTTGYAFLTASALEAILAKPHSESFPARQTEDIELASSVFKITKNAPQSVGAVYSGKGILDGDKVVRMITNGLRFRTSYSSPFAAAWKQMHDEVELTKRRQTAEKNAINDPAMAKAVEVIKDRYKKLPAGYRRAWQLWFLAELEKRG